jgi:ABC-type cobalamin/Fe3+-siderophores transport system ATPase subunit
MQIIIKKIAKNNIFKDDFLNLVKNNIIDFANANISIIYGPNGAGKTSLAKVFNKENAAYSISIDGKEYTEKDDKIAHIINDQNDRNIIAGNTEDFIMGDNIRREYELKDQLEKGFTGLFSELIGELKGKFGISTMKSPFHEFIKNESIKIYISNLANTKQKCKGINRYEFITYINSIVPFEEQEVDQEIFNYFVNDIKNKESILSSLEKMDLKTVKQKPYFKKIEETEDAVKILEKYQDIEECIVCDNTFEIEKQLPKKKAQNKTAIDSLDEQSKKIIENIIKKITDTDPLDIKNKLRNALLTGDKKGIDEIIAILKKCEDIYDKLMTNYFISSLRKSGLAEINSEYSQIVLGKPEFEDEDVIFIENFLNECLDRKIKLDRDENKNLKLLLGET